MFLIKVEFHFLKINGIKIQSNKNKMTLIEKKKNGFWVN